MNNRHPQFIIDWMNRMKKMSGDTTPVKEKVLDVAPPPAKEWPFLARPLKLLAKEGDLGLGDVVARVIGPVGGDAFKEWFKKIFGRECRCADRQAWLNRRFPLTTTEKESQ